MHSSNEESIIAKIKNSSDLDDLFLILRELRYLTPGQRIRNLIAKAVASDESRSPLKVAILGNFTLDLFPNECRAAFSLWGVKTDCYVAPYDQYYQALLNDNTDLIKFTPEIVVLALDLRKLAPKIYYEFDLLSEAEKDNILDFVISHVLDWARLALQKINGQILVSNFILPNDNTLGVASGYSSETSIEFIHRINCILRKKLVEYEQVNILDTMSLSQRIGHDVRYSAKLYYLAKILWSNDFLFGLSHLIVKNYFAYASLTKKCLVLDLDNTLWGGVLGEDGIDGIKVGSGNPASEAFFDFQRQILTLKQRGILLAICSKNNLSNVEELFEKRNDMPLSLKDFSSVRINWEYKHLNINSIAQELNIGIDSIVFVDDNPVEIEMVNEMLPAVETILLPHTIEELPELLYSTPFFEKLRILQDDKNKAEQYTQNKEREVLAKSLGSVEDYLRSLETKVVFRLVEDKDLARAHQLFNKTNQFNTTTKRYAPSQVKELMDNEDIDFWCYEVSDRFGNLGIVGLVVLCKIVDGYEIDSFLMSCRAMGRQIETAIINKLQDEYLSIRNEAALFARFIPTSKNKPIENLFLDHGFTITTKNQQNECYRFNQNSKRIRFCDWIKFES